MYDIAKWTLAASDKNFIKGMNYIDLGKTIDECLGESNLVLLLLEIISISPVRTAMISRVAVGM